MGKDLKFEVIPRGVIVDYIVPGKWTFIQRRAEYGGGWWFGRAYDNCFYLELERPTSLADGIAYINAYDRVNELTDFDEDFHLEG